jgi:hypothetical protein
VVVAATIGDWLCFLVLALARLLALLPAGFGSIVLPKATKPSASTGPEMRPPPAFWMVAQLAFVRRAWGRFFAAILFRPLCIDINKPPSWVT